MFLTSVPKNKPWRAFEAANKLAWIAGLCRARRREPRARGYRPLNPGLPVSVR
jgi:hypothetical protein